LKKIRRKQEGLPLSIEYYFHTTVLYVAARQKFVADSESFLVPKKYYTVI
jgi:hypothetical protein